MLTYKQIKKLNHEGKLFDYITSEENVLLAYKQTQKGSPKHKIPAIRFRQSETTNLAELAQSVKDGTWKPRGYYRFEIHDPKHRIIFAPAYEDKIVHHMIYQVLRELYEPKFIYDSYSCIRGKGNQRAVERLQQHYKVAKATMEDPHLVKIDIKKFFPSIPRCVLKRIYAQDITCKNTLALVYEIIDNSPKDIGLPLGCVTSQLSANVLMNKFDHFAKRELKIKHYLRYADDIFIIVDGKEEAQKTLNKCKEYLNTELLLSFSSGKCYTQKLGDSVLGLGYKVGNNIRMKSFNKKRVLKRLSKYIEDPSRNNRNSLMAANSYISLCTDMGFIDKHFSGTDLYDLLFNTNTKVGTLRKCRKVYLKRGWPPRGLLQQHSGLC